MTSISIRFTLESAEQYHAHAGVFLSSHLLAKFRQSPLEYLRCLEGGTHDENCPPFLIGSAVHCLVLEGRRVFEQRYGNHPLLNRQQHYEIGRMADSVLIHPIAERLLDDGDAEIVLRAEYCELACQARLDWFNPRWGIVDLKTCHNLDCFESDALRYGYFYQMAFYRSIVANVARMLVPVHIIAVEKNPPFRCGVWCISHRTLRACQLENERAIERLKWCSTFDYWPAKADVFQPFCVV